MLNGIDNNVKGMADIAKLFESLPETLEKRVLLRSLQAGGRVVLKAARANLAASGANDTKALSASLGLRQRKRSNRAGLVVSLGARRGFARQATRRGRAKAEKINPSKYAHLVEFGTKHSAAKPFLRPAIDANGGAAIGAILQSSAKFIEQELRALATGKKSFVTGRKR